MPTPILTLPAEIRAGDTLLLTKTVSGYPASAGWVLRYTFVNQGHAFTIASTPDGDAHEFNVASATTAAWAAGMYRVQAYITSGADRFTVATCSTRILPNLAAAGAEGIDARSHARKVVDSIEAWLERRAPTMASFQIDGRSVANYPIADLLALLDRYRGIVRNEERIETGGAPARMLARF